MDEVTQKWRIFLREDKNNSYQIFCDMDGVLVDLAAGILKEAELFFGDIQDEEQKKAKNAVMKIIANKDVMWQKHKDNPKLNKGLEFIFDLLENNEDFGANKLEPMGDAMELWKYISKHDPIILTAPWKVDDKVDAACVRGKYQWIQKNLDPKPKKIIIAGTENEESKDDTSKHRYANPRHILIDDMNKYINPWKINKGIAIKHKSTKETIQILERLLEQSNETN